MGTEKTRQPKDKSLWGIIVSAASMITALCSLWLAWYSVQQSEHTSRVSAYLQMRDDFNTVAAAIPEKYYHADFKNAPNRDSSAWRAIQNYWYFTFDEWYTSTRLDPDDSKALWKNYYLHVIEAMMEKPVPRKVLCYLIARKFSENRVQTEFSGTLENIYANVGNHHGAKLCP